MARRASRLSCSSRRAWRLSNSFLPRASAISALTRPSLKYRLSGTIVYPLASMPRASLVICSRCSSNLRLRLGAWLFHVPFRYSGMFAPSSHISPRRSMEMNASDSDARPSRNDLTSVPVRASPASYLSSMA